MNGDAEDTWANTVSPSPFVGTLLEADGQQVDQSIGYVRDYLREKLRANRLSTDYREGSRVKTSNAKVRPEPIPEHNDPYRIEWTEINGKKYFIGEEVRCVTQYPVSSSY